MPGVALSWAMATLSRRLHPLRLLSVSHSCWSDPRPLLWGVGNLSGASTDVSSFQARTGSPRGFEAAPILCGGYGYRWDGEGRLAHALADGRLSSGLRQRSCWAPRVREGCQEDGLPETAGSRVWRQKGSRSFRVWSESGGGLEQTAERRAKWEPLKFEEAAWQRALNARLREEDLVVWAMGRTEKALEKQWCFRKAETRVTRRGGTLGRRQRRVFLWYRLKVTCGHSGEGTGS